MWSNPMTQEVCQNVCYDVSPNPDLCIFEEHPCIVTPQYISRILTSIF